MRNSLRFGRTLRWCFHLAFGTLLASGVLWLVASSAHGTSLGPGAAGSWIEPWLLRIHGAAAMASLLVLGGLTPVHAHAAWARARNRATGGAVVFALMLMIVTGWALYYCGDDEARRVISSLHSIAGCALPLLLVGHVLVGRR